MRVARINLVYNIDELIELEDKLKEAVKEKQNYLEVRGELDPRDEKLHAHDEAI